MSVVAGKTILNRPQGSDENGMILNEETVEIKIPPGVEEGMQLKVSGKGNASPGDGISGDLLVLIEEVSDEKFIREGNHIHHDLYISISEAALGVSKDIDLLEGKEIIVDFKRTSSDGRFIGIEKTISLEEGGQNIPSDNSENVPF